MQNNDKLFTDIYSSLAKEYVFICNINNHIYYNL